MHLSRIRVVNFRNFKELDVPVSRNVVVVGENRVGKSNLLYALRLLFDPSLPDSARQLVLADFWDGLKRPGAKDKIVVSVEIKDFEDNLGVLAELTDYRLDDDPETIRLTYEFRPKADLEDAPASADDYTFVCYGGENEAKRFGWDLRRRISMDLLQALRDAEGDLAVWRRSPLRPLIERAFATVATADLEKIGDEIRKATGKLSDFDDVETLEENIGELFAEMSGPRQDIKPRLGVSTTEATKLYRNIRLLIDEGRRGIGDASLGSANLVFLTLKTLALHQLVDEGQHEHVFLAIEEPEAHLHPHLQRSVYRHLFETAGKEDSPLSVILTTHSPHIASVAPLSSVVLLKDAGDRGAIGRSTATMELSPEDADDLARYLDVTRAEMLFARGVILVEGDAERFVVPVFAEALDKRLDHLGITVCSVAGTNFDPYVRLLTALGIPFAVITDWDPTGANGNGLGAARSKKLVESIQTERTGAVPAAVTRALGVTDPAAIRTAVARHGIFLNEHTLEVDLFRDAFAAAIIETLREVNFSAARRTKLDAWEADSDDLDPEEFLKMVEQIGKGRFAQRLASRIGGTAPPDYIRLAIEFVAGRV
jgi:putative ATP-dependent endonuclease of OLD family